MYWWMKEKPRPTSVFRDTPVGRTLAYGCHSAPLSCVGFRPCSAWEQEEDSSCPWSILTGSQKVAKSGISSYLLDTRAHPDTCPCGWCGWLRAMLWLIQALGNALGFLGDASGKEPVFQFRRHETWVRFLGWEDPLEEGVATHSSVLAWSVSWTEEPGGLQSIASQNQTWLSELAHTHSSYVRGFQIYYFFSIRNTLQVKSCEGKHYKNILKC